MVETTLSLKDYFPLIGTALTVGAGYFFLTTQVRKNRRAKWIDDFRKEVSNFTAAIARNIDSPSMENLYPILVAVHAVELYLDFTNKNHREFVKQMANLTNDMAKKTSEIEERLQFETDVMQTLIKGMISIQSKAREIIAIEQKKI